MRRQVSMAGSPTLPTGPDLALLRDVVSDKIFKAMDDASKQLTRSNIRHALVGSLGIGSYGNPRSTKDVDFLVGPEAFTEHSGGIVTFSPGIPLEVNGVAIDSISVAPDEGFLEDGLDNPEESFGIPIAPLEAIVYMKLKSPRRKDRIDLVELFKLDVDIVRIGNYIAKNAPSLLPKFEMILSQSEEEG